MNVTTSNNNKESEYESRNGFTRAIETIWLCGIFLIPLFFNPASHQAFYLNKALLLQFLVIIMVALSIGDCIYRKLTPGKFFLQRREVTSLFIAIGLFGLVAIISTIFSITPSVSFWGSWGRKAGLLTILLWIAFFLIMTGYMRTRKQFYRAVIALLLSSGFVALLGILQHYFPESNAILGYRRFSERVFSTTGNALALSGFLTMVIPFTLAVAFSIWNRKNDSRKVLNRTGIIVLLALQFWCLYLAQYSITILLFIIAPVIFITLLGIVNKRLFLFGTGLIALLLIATIAGLLILPLVFSPTTNTISTDNELSPTTGNAENVGLYTLGNRVQHWMNTIQMIAESKANPVWNDNIPSLRPFIGYGPETFVVTYQRYYPEEFKANVTYNSMLMDRPHNHYLYVVASMGILGLLCFLASIISFLYLGFCLIRKTDIYDNRVFLVGMIASIAGYLVDSLFNPSTILTELVFWLVLALMIVMGKCVFNSQEKLQVTDDEHDIQRMPGFPGYSTRICVYCATCLTLGIIILGSIMNAKPFLADIHLQRGLDLRVVDIEQALNEYERAIELQPNVAAYWGFLGDYGYFIARSFNDTSMKKEFLMLSTNSYEKARELEPYIAYRYYTLADVYIYAAINENGDKWPVVFSLYDRALQLFPDNVVIMNKWSSALFIKGDITEARAKRDLSAKIDPNWSETKFLSALYLTAQNENDRAVEIIINEIGKLKVNRNYYNHFGRFCFRLASYNVLEQLHHAVAMYSKKAITEDWHVHAIYGITSFYIGDRETSTSEFSKAMYAVPDNEAGTLFQSIFGLTRLDLYFATMITDVASDWRDKLERTPDSDNVLEMYDYLLVKYREEL